MTAKVITVANQKGGIGKSTTALNLGAFLSKQGNRVLFVDLDPQGNLSYSLNLTGREGNTVDLLTAQEKPEDCIHSVDLGKGIPSLPALAAVNPEDEGVLKAALEGLKADFDYILIDTPPTLGMLTLNALTASDFVLIPVQASIFSLQGLGQLNSTIQAVQKYANPDLQIAGILITRFKPRASLSKQMQQMIKDSAELMETKLFDTAIRETIALEEANALKTDIFTYKPKSNGAADYAAFGAEFLETIEGQRG